ncbi:hypothetical protein EON82_08545 [bacterium]|nr:MAG: hypothetical protein EON82_08545 [bacterium]
MAVRSFSVRNFRKIGNQGVNLDEWEAVNVLVGPNNAGKSSLLKIAEDCFTAIRKQSLPLETEDFHRLNFNHPVEVEASVDRTLSGDAWDWVLRDQVRYRLVANREATKLSCVLDQSLPPDTIANAIRHLAGRHINEREPEHIRTSCEWLEEHYPGTRRAANWSELPSVVHVPEYRQIRAGESPTVDGTGLFSRLAMLQNPDAGPSRDSFRQQFEHIQEAIRQLLGDPKLTIEIPFSRNTIIINHDGLSLGIERHGAGIHQAAIILSTALASEALLVLIEEPEIHLHPRMQRRFLDILLGMSEKQYVVTSHSSAFMNFASQHADRGVSI